TFMDETLSEKEKKVSFTKFRSTGRLCIPVGIKKLFLKSVVQKFRYFRSASDQKEMIEIVRRRSSIDENYAPATSQNRHLSENTLHSSTLDQSRNGHSSRVSKSLRCLKERFASHKHNSADDPKNVGYYFVDSEGLDIVFIDNPIGGNDNYLEHTITAFSDSYESSPQQDNVKSRRTELSSNIDILTTTHENQQQTNAESYPLFNRYNPVNIKPSVESQSLKYSFYSTMIDVDYGQATSAGIECDSQIIVPEQTHLFPNRSIFCIPDGAISTVPSTSSSGSSLSKIDDQWHDSYDQNLMSLNDDEHIMLQQEALEQIIRFRILFENKLDDLRLDDDDDEVQTSAELYQQALNMNALLKKELKELQDHLWTCDSCTFINKSSADVRDDVCEMCARPNEHPYWNNPRAIIDEPQMEFDDHDIGLIADKEIDDFEIDY
ncbi:unnamed protein product, partial [Didymodactylos carnosus]